MVEKGFSPKSDFAAKLLPVVAHSHLQATIQR